MFSSSSFSSLRYNAPIYRNSNVILPPEEDKGALILGDMTAAFNSKDLKKKGVNSVLTVAARLGISYKRNDLSHKVYPALDSETYDLSKYFEDSFKFIDEALKNGGVLVHCAAGISRSSAIVIAYLMKKKKWTVDEAYRFVKKRRSVICPNSGFVRQLRNYQKKLGIPA